MDINLEVKIVADYSGKYSGKGPGNNLLYSYTFSQVSGLVNIAAQTYRDKIG